MRTPNVSRLCVSGITEADRVVVFPPSNPLSKKAIVSPGPGRIMVLFGHPDLVHNAAGRATAASLCYVARRIEVNGLADHRVWSRAEVTVVSSRLSLFHSGLPSEAPA